MNAGSRMIRFPSGTWHFLAVIVTTFLAIAVKIYYLVTCTSNSTIIREAFIRVEIFIMVAGVVSFLSLKQKWSEEGQNHA
jgi:hypothetical protein